MMERIKAKIFDEFDKLLEKCLLEQDVHNSILELRNRIALIYGNILTEFKIYAKYDKYVDILNSDIKRINLDKSDNPYWLKGEIHRERPPGPTNEEISELLLMVRDIFKKKNEIIENIRKAIKDTLIEIENHVQYNELIFSSLSMLEHNIFHELIAPLDFIETEIRNEIKKTFQLPNDNIPFVKGMYDRSPHPYYEITQNLPCEICGENRAIDNCHIIPVHLGGLSKNGNTIYLCPTHHRLFDRFMLFKEEWDKIDWSKTSKISSNFAYHILKPEFEKFWNNLENKSHKKNTYTYEIIYMGGIEEIKKSILEIIEHNSSLSIKELSDKSNIKSSYCRMVIKSLLMDGVIEKTKYKNKVVYKIKK